MPAQLQALTSDQARALTTAQIASLSFVQASAIEASDLAGCPPYKSAPCSPVPRTSPP
jgi:hypothetical protein